MAHAVIPELLPIPVYACDGRAEKLSFVKVVKSCDLKVVGCAVTIPGSCAAVSHRHIVIGANHCVRQMHILFFPDTICQITVRVNKVQMQYSVPVHGNIVMRKAVCKRLKPLSVFLMLLWASQIIDRPASVCLNHMLYQLIKSAVIVHTDKRCTRKLLVDT